MLSSQKETAPRYQQTAQYAREHGELEQYRASRRMDTACKEAIEAAIREGFDGMHLKDGTAARVMEEFSAERVAYVLANTIQQKDWDNRFSRDNKAWAQSIPMFEPQERRYECMVESHPAVLDGFVKLFRAELEKGRAAQAKQRPSIRDQLAAPPVTGEPPATRPKDRDAR